MRADHRFVVASFVVAVSGIAGGRVARADDAADAQALFDQGIKDLQANKLEVACKELAASLTKHEDSGTKGALATCYSMQNKVASAWQLWKDLADTAPSGDMKADAIKQATALEPRLPHYVLKVQGVPGLVVTVGKSEVKDFSVSVPLPIDPGGVLVTAKAPGYHDWQTTVTAAEGQQVEIVVPAFIPLPNSKAEQDARTAKELEASRHSHHVIALGVGGGGAAALIVGSIFGSVASSDFSKVKSDCGGMLNACPAGQLAAAKSEFNSANTAATVSTAMFIIGGVAVAAAAYFWFTAPHAEQAPVALRVMPTVDEHGGGLVLSGGF